MSLPSPSANDYHRIGNDQSSSTPKGVGFALRLTATLGLGMGVITLACLTLPRGPGLSTAPEGKASVLAAGHGLRRGYASHFCNCPPTEVVWTCTEEQYQSIMNGTTCPYYKKAATKCGACSRSTTSSACRACELGLSRKSFCDECLQQGLNDVGCMDCSPAPAPAALVGADADEHGCRPSAGYRWCPSTSACVRPWELGVRTAEALKDKCTPAASAEEVQLGGDADSHGCRPSAGYLWCEAMASCVRPREKGIRSSEAFAAKCEGKAMTLLGGDVDKHGCRPSAGYSWCEAMSECIRPWEHGLTDASAMKTRCLPRQVAHVHP